MGLPQIVDLARHFAVMVRVQGPDPKGVKMRNHAFHHYDSGKTTLQASGMLLPDSLYDAEAAKGVLDCNNGNFRLVVTMASVIEPFLSLQHREALSQGRPELISGARIGIMVEDIVRAGKVIDKGAPSWLEAQLLTLVNVPASTIAFQSITKASSGSLEDGWEVGWSLASHGNKPQSSMDITQKQIESEKRSFKENQKHLEAGKSSSLSLMGRSSVRIAILGLPLSSVDLPNIASASSCKRGDLLLAVGSPFGVLSPVHFFNSISVGSIANCFPPSSSNRSLALLMADIRCLPGMEGGPVFGEHGHLIGILSRPLKHKISGAEIQLVIPWEAIATACSDLLQEPQNAEKRIYYNKHNLNAVGKAFTGNSHCSNGPLSYIHEHPSLCCTSPTKVEKAMISVCLITVDDGVWASGVLLNKQGLILTNAHLLEPWRFGKTAISSGRHGIKSEISFSSDDAVPPRNDKVDDHKSPNLLSQRPKIPNSSSGNEHNMFYKGHRNIQVRLDHMDPWIWSDAKPLYVCKGPLDIALLQLDKVPHQLSPISMDFESPSLGSKAFVIGHGLLGPKCGFFPSVCSGVVAKVVKAEMPLSYEPFFKSGTKHLPAMLETTAAVNPGASGGAVVNSDGHMIGLVTSNTKHGGGTIIPHLNFSIPCAALAPIFKFSKDMREISLLQDLDRQNEQVSFVWALMPPLSPKAGPAILPEQDNEKEVKGSRFAKFIAERRPTKPGELEKLSNAIISSKL